MTVKLMLSEILEKVIFYSSELKDMKFFMPSKPTD